MKKKRSDIGHKINHSGRVKEAGLSTATILSSAAIMAVLATIIYMRHAVISGSIEPALPLVVIIVETIMLPDRHRRIVEIGDVIGIAHPAAHARRLKAVTMVVCALIVGVTGICNVVLEHSLTLSRINMAVLPAILMVIGFFQDRVRDELRRIQADVLAHECQSV